MPTLIMSSPKFITCPDCGERYDNARKRRLIDTCGHPRCYSCMFVDNPCVLCTKLPQGRPRASTSSSITDSEVTNKADGHNEPQQGVQLRRDQTYKGSHPNLSELHKERSATLPVFRADSYFRSLYRYEPNGSQENLNSSGRNSPTLRPRSMPPSYHKSLENLHEQFWRSVQHVQRASSPDSPRSRDSHADRKSKTPSPTSPMTSPPEIITCPAPDSIRLPVPDNRPRSQTDLSTILQEEREKIKKELQLQALKKMEIPQTRARSHSDLTVQIQYERSTSQEEADRLRSVLNNRRPQSWSPTNFRTACHQIDSIRQSGSPPSSNTMSSGSPRPQMWLPIHSRTTPMSDGSSETEIHFSDSCSDSSPDSESHPPSPFQRSTGTARQEIDDGNRSYARDSSFNQSQGRLTVSPLANVTYWVVNSSRNSPEVHRGFVETDLDAVIKDQASTINTHAQRCNGHSEDTSNVPMANVQTKVV